MQWQTLESTSLETIHAALSDAFSDYLVPFQLSLAEMEEMFIRRGFVPQLSMGGFDHGRLVAFTINGAGLREGVPTVYDSSTGVVRDRRNRGLGREMMLRIVTHLRQGHAAHYLLEVLEENTPAVRLYRRAGFEILRRLQCWKFDMNGRGELAAGVEISDGPVGQCSLSGWRDLVPSWQNSDDSIARSRAAKRILIARRAGAAVGFAVVYPANGDLAQLAVDPSHRRNRIGTALLHAAAEASTRPLRVINIDDASGPVRRFLEQSGAQPTVRQFEMRLVLR